jgi:hypothetical protein
MGQVLEKGRGKRVATGFDSEGEEKDESEL